MWTGRSIGSISIIKQCKSCCLRYFSSSFVFQWIEECLQNIESSTSKSTNHFDSNPTTTTLFESLPYNNDQVDFDWVSRYITSGESNNHSMFVDQGKSFPQSTAPIFIPQPTRTTSDNFLNFFNVSTDDEHSNSDHQRRRIHSSFEVRSSLCKHQFHHLFRVILSLVIVNSFLSHYRSNRN